MNIPLGIEPLLPVVFKVLVGMHMVWPTFKGLVGNAMEKKKNGCGTSSTKDAGKSKCPRGVLETRKHLHATAIPQWFGGSDWRGAQLLRKG